LYDTILTAIIIILSKTLKYNREMIVSAKIVHRNTVYLEKFIGHKNIVKL